jgi:sec-independent protein translocase protein TatB
MFDFAFSELVVIMVVALVVIGPERLPKVARTAGLLWGRAQRYVNSVKHDIAKDLAIEEVQQLHGAILKEVGAVEKATQEAGKALERRMMLAQQGILAEVTDVDDLHPAPSKDKPDVKP